MHENSRMRGQDWKQDLVPQKDVLPLKASLSAQEPLQVFHVTLTKAIICLLPLLTFMLLVQSGFILWRKLVVGLSLVQRVLT